MIQMKKGATPFFCIIIYAMMFDSVHRQLEGEITFVEADPRRVAAQS